MPFYKTVLFWPIISGILVAACITLAVITIRTNSALKAEKANIQKYDAVRNANISLFEKYQKKIDSVAKERDALKDELSKSLSKQQQISKNYTPLYDEIINSRDDIATADKLLSINRQQPFSR